MNSVHWTEWETANFWMIKDLFIIGCECEVDFMATSIVRYISSFQKGGDTYQY